LPIATGLAIGLGAAAAAGSVGSAAIAAHGAGKAADTQAAAAQQAAQLQYQSGQNALDFQKQVYGTQQQQMAPWLGAGQAGLANLSYLMGLNPGGGGGTAPAGQFSAAPAMAAQPGVGAVPGMPIDQTAANTRLLGGMTPAPGTPQALSAGSASVPGGTPQGGLTTLQGLINPSLGASGSLMAPWTQQFQAPTDVTEQNDPGYKFRLQQGMDALQNSAAAKGTLLTGGTAAGIQRYGQDYASNEYGNVYNRALGEYQNSYNIFKQNQADQYNRLAAISGLGQTAASQLGQFGANAAGNVGNILMGTAGQVGQQLGNAAAARATGYQNAGNIWGNALGGIPGNLMSMAALMGQGGMNQGGGGYPNFAGGAGQYNPVTGQYNG